MAWAVAPGGGADRSPYHPPPYKEPWPKLPRSAIGWVETPDARRIPAIRSYLVNNDARALCLSTPSDRSVFLPSCLCEKKYSYIGIDCRIYCDDICNRKIKENTVCFAVEEAANRSSMDHCESLTSDGEC